MAGDDIQNLLRSGIEAARSGNKAVARAILEQVITMDSQNEMAWLWLASVMDSGEERQRALRRVLSINPDNERAQQALRKLQTGALRPVQDEQIPRPEPIPPPPPPSLPQAQPLPQRSRPQQQRGRRKGWSTQSQLAIVLAMIMIIVAGALISREITRPEEIVNTPSQFSDFQSRTPTQTLTPTITNTPRPTRTISPDTIIVTELPSQWTPEAEVSSTPLPEPTAKPDTRSALEIIFSGGNQASDAAQLLTVRADADLLPRRLTVDIDSEFPELELLDPAYSPDGRMLAFTAQIAPEVQEIFILSLDNGALRQLTDLGASITDGATWSADSERLVFSSNAPSTSRATIFDIFEIDVDTGESSALTDGTARSREPVWSPDGALLAFSSDKDSPGEREIWLIAMNTGSRTPEKITDAANSSFAPTFSPNSAQIAFISNRGGDNDVFVMNADGTSERLISTDDNGIDDRDPAWSPDGNWILVSSDRSGGPNLQLWLVRPDGSDWTPVTEGEGNNRSGYWLPIN